MLFLGFSLAVAIAILGLYIATPILGQEKTEIEQLITQALHQPVKIGSSQGIWQNAQPVLILKNITIFDAANAQPVLKISEIHAGFKILASLWQRAPVFKSIYINGANIKLHQDNSNKITLIGLAGIDPPSADTFNFAEFWNWITSKNKIALDNISVDWQKPDGQWVKISYFKLRLTNNWYEHQGNLKINHTEVGELLKGFSPQGWQVTTGKIKSLSIQWAFHYQTLNYLKGSINADNMHIIAPNQLSWQINSLLSHFLWHGKINDQWLLKLQRLQFNLDGKNWLEKNLQVNVLPFKQGGLLCTVRASNLHLPNLWPLLNKLRLLSPDQQELITHLNPQGDLKNIYIEYPLQEKNTADFINKKPLASLPTKPMLALNSYPSLGWKFSAEIHHINTMPWNKIPGVEQLSGYLQASNTTGQFRLDSEKLKLIMPQVFRTALFFEQAQADIDLHLLSTGYKVNAANVAINNADAKFKGDMSLWLPKGAQSPFINLFGEFKINPGAKVPPYLPTSIMKPNLVKWLDQAFVAIDGGNGTLVLRGPLHYFPFPNKEGIFAVHTQISSLTFRYFPGWPIITNLMGMLNFDGPKMSVAVRAGKIFGTQIRSAYAEIPAILKGIESQLFLKVNTLGDLRDASHFIQQSPLNKKLGSTFDPIKLDGDSEINLRLNIPLENDQMPIEISGNIDMAEAKVVLPFKQLALENITGTLHFTQNSVQADDIQAEFLHAPASLNIETDKNSQISCLLNGKARMADLQKALQIPNMPLIEGNFSYQAKLTIPHGEESNSFSITSNLKGIKIDLPMPFKKLSDALAPSEINVKFDEDEHLQLQFNYNDHLKGILKYGTKSFTFEQGNIVIGEGKAMLPEESGLWITGSVPYVAWNDWKHFFQSNSKHTQKQKDLAITWPAFLKQIRLEFKAIQLFDQTFQNMLLNLSKTNDYWLLGIKNANIIGEINIPLDQESAWKARFQKLYLPENKSSTSSHLDPMDLPTLNFFAQDFRYANKQFGQTQLILEPLDNGIKIQKISFSSPAFSLMAQGSWQALADHQQTNLTGRMNIANIGETLMRFGMPASIVGRNGKLAFNLEWLGAPYSPFMKSFSGYLDVTLNQGRIMGLSEEASRKIGIGELLTFFSLQNLPRRLAFDFSDLSRQGFPFDYMHGSFTLKEGNAYTNDTHWEGSVAHISMKGRISLADEKYDVYLNVTPYITSSLPLVATIAGGPVVGLTTWVADKLLSHQVAKLMTYSYRLSGPWSNPTLVESNSAAS